MGFTGWLHSVVMNLGESVQLNASTNYATATYQWSPNIGLSCYDCANPTIETIYSINYSLSVSVDIAGNSCTNQVNVGVTVLPHYVIFVPNSFTPNSDGNNDFLEVFGNKDAWKQFEIQLFNRWGEKVYESGDMNFKFDGTYKGIFMQPQALLYQLHITYIDNYTPTLYKGSITLLR